MQPIEGVHFLHLRHYDSSGRPVNCGGMTLAWEIVDRKDNLFKIRIGKSICSERDTFWRKRGRDIATERMKNPVELLNFCGRKLNAEITTTHTLKEDIHNTLQNWAYDV